MRAAAPHGASAPCRSPSCALTPPALAAGRSPRGLHAVHAGAGRARPPWSASASTSWSGSPGRSRSATSASMPSAPIRSAILTLQGRELLAGAAAAGVMAGVVGALLALPAMRVTGPYLAMMTIAFAFIVEHGTIEWRGLTGGAERPDGHRAAVDRLARIRRARDGDAGGRCSPALSLYLFHRLAAQRLGQGHGGGARQRDRGARGRAQSRDRQDRGVRPVGGVHRPRRRRCSRR